MKTERRETFIDDQGRRRFTLLVKLYLRLDGLLRFRFRDQISVRPVLVKRHRHRELAARAGPVSGGITDRDILNVAGGNSIRSVDEFSTDNHRFDFFRLHGHIGSFRFNDRVYNVREKVENRVDDEETNFRDTESGGRTGRLIVGSEMVRNNNRRRERATCGYTFYARGLLYEAAEARTFCRRSVAHATFIISHFSTGISRLPRTSAE